jgi:hypothetical protein
MIISLPVILQQGSSLGAIQVIGNLDGGNGCHGFTSLTSVFQYFPYIAYQVVNDTGV